MTARIGNFVPSRRAADQNLPSASEQERGLLGHDSRHALAQTVRRAQEQHTARPDLANAATA